MSYHDEQALSDYMAARERHLHHAAAAYDQANPAPQRLLQSPFVEKQMERQADWNWTSALHSIRRRNALHQAQQAFEAAYPPTTSSASACAARERSQR
jgi:hypothetical protein